MTGGGHSPMSPPPLATRLKTIHVKHVACDELSYRSGTMKKFTETRHYWENIALCATLDHRPSKLTVCPALIYLYPLRKYRLRY